MGFFYYIVIFIFNGIKYFVMFRIYNIVNIIMYIDKL